MKTTFFDELSSVEMMSCNGGEEKTGDKTQEWLLNIWNWILGED